MEYNETKKLKNWCMKLLKDDFDKFDFQSHTDNKLTLEENKTILREKIRNFINEHSEEKIAKMKKRDAEIISKEEYEQKLSLEFEKAEEKAEEEFNKTLEEIQNKETSDFIEDIFYIPKQFSKMVIKGNSRGFLLYGEAGLGKSFSVVRAFKEEGKKFVLLTGHITSLELYHFLYKHQKEIIILDDVNVLENEQNLNLLKSCLSENTRLVQYHTTSAKLKFPSKFVFNGAIIILLNDKPKNSESLKAVESRILTYELKFDYHTKIKLIFELAKQEYKDLSLNQRQTIANWIKNNTSQATKNLNLRLLFQIYEIFRFDILNWKKLSSKLIETDEEIYLIVQGLTANEWIEETGKSKATFFRYKNKLVSKSHDFKV